MTDKKMTFDAIKNELARLDVKLADIAEAKGVSAPHVTNVAKGLVKSERVARAICLSLNKELAEVFGDTYSAKGKRGPKDRSIRKLEIITAIKAGKPVPKPSMTLSAN
ncbi:hypothetical protein HUZ36_05230 [Pseudoalteromonas sp. McH1-7]|uniref:hypothetical protein n=1 Tax=Pseudoalteromonas sp. McH1-7 TaxID=2745574 RepID=UPI00159283B9|nr:hypothetical protein [Pseudoalteromonas sp. McH1-7]NUZ10177.1 hypothetical protein [Pseudoalteromonas sp. McH1-7]